MGSIYYIVKSYGIYEIIRVDDIRWEVVQTNIRTRKKAVEACKIWQEREWLKNQTSPFKENELPMP
jgi:hypothetical protein